MGRIALVVYETELRSELEKLEANASFENRSRLYEALCETPWAKSVKDAKGRTRGLTVANVYQRVKEFNLDAKLKTPQGKRGNPNIGVRLSPTEKKDRISKRPGFLLTMNRLKADIFSHFGKMPEPLAKLLKKLERGNKAAAVKLKCLECCCWNAQEAGRCTVYGCPLHLINPFIKKAGDTSPIEITAEAEDED